MTSFLQECLVKQIEQLEQENFDLRLDRQMLLCENNLIKQRNEELEERLSLRYSDDMK